MCMVYCKNEIKHQNMITDKLIQNLIDNINQWRAKKILDLRQTIIRPSMYLPTSFNLHFYFYLIV
jgi:hypothetical protein